MLGNMNNFQPTAMERKQLATSNHGEPGEREREESLIIGHNDRYVRLETFTKLQPIFKVNA